MMVQYHFKKRDIYLSFFIKYIIMNIYKWRKKMYEHTFDIDENITVEEFQNLLDNAKTTFLNSLNKIENDEQLWEKY